MEGLVLIVSLLGALVSLLVVSVFFSVASRWVKVQEERLALEKEMIRSVREENQATKQSLGELKDALRGAIVLGRGTSSNN